MVFIQDTSFFHRLCPVGLHKFLEWINLILFFNSIITVVFKLSIILS